MFSRLSVEPFPPSIINSLADGKFVDTMYKSHNPASIKTIGHASDLETHTYKSDALKYGYGFSLGPNQKTQSFT